jgi:phage baseplate assembly protein V
MRFLQPLKIKIQLMIGRAVLLAVDNTGKTQRLRLQFGQDEAIERIERIQEYGFDTNPPVADSSEVAYVSIAGNRGLTYVIATQVREFRPSPALAAGEVMMYSKFGQKIHLKTDGSVTIDAGANAVNVTGSDITLTGNVNLKDAGGEPVMLATVITKLNNHTHLETGGTTGTMTAGGTTLVAGTDSAADVKAKP